MEENSQTDQSNQQDVVNSDMEAKDSLISALLADLNENDRVIESWKAENRPGCDFDELQTNFDQLRADKVELEAKFRKFVIDFESPLNFVDPVSEFVEKIRQENVELERELVEAKIRTKKSEFDRVKVLAEKVRVENDLEKSKRKLKVLSVISEELTSSKENEQKLQRKTEEMAKELDDIRGQNGRLKAKACLLFRCLRNLKNEHGELKQFGEDLKRSGPFNEDTLKKLKELSLEVQCDKLDTKDDEEMGKVNSDCGSSGTGSFKFEFEVDERRIGLDEANERRPSLMDGIEPTNKLIGGVVEAEWMNSLVEKNEALKNQTNALSASDEEITYLKELVDRKDEMLDVLKKEVEALKVKKEEETSLGKPAIKEAAKGVKPAEVISTIGEKVLKKKLDLKSQELQSVRKSNNELLKEVTQLRKIMRVKLNNENFMNDVDDLVLAIKEDGVLYRNVLAENQKLREKIESIEEQKLNMFDLVLERLQLRDEL